MKKHVSFPSAKSSDGAAFCNARYLQPRTVWDRDFGTENQSHLNAMSSCAAAELWWDKEAFFRATALGQGMSQ